MSHEIHIDIRGKASMCYLNDTPWHGLGQKLTANAPIEKWMKEAGMYYTILGAPVQYQTPAGLLEAGNRNVLYRSDDHAPLGFVGNGYKVVQPQEVMEFFRDITESQQFELETAGVLFNGAKYWALAKTGKTARIGAKGSKDIINGYLLLSTSCDGTLQTQAQFTSVRVVCNNTLTAATRGQGTKDNNAVKVSHRSVFNPDVVKQQLGIEGHWTEFVDGANELAAIKIADKEALDFIVRIMQDKDTSKAVATTYQLYKGKGRGAELKSSEGTVWGLVNSISEYVDHFAGVSPDNRFYLSQFYDGSYLKNNAFQEAMKEFATA